MSSSAGIFFPYLAKLDDFKTLQLPLLFRLFPTNVNPTNSDENTKATFKGILKPVAGLGHKTNISKLWGKKTNWNYLKKNALLGTLIEW